MAKNIEYRLIVDTNNKPVMEGNNNIWLQQIEDDKCVCVPLTEQLSQQLNLTISESSDDVAEENSSKSRIWSRNAILMLISQVKDFQAQFLSTTMKNDKVWARIATEMSKYGHKLTPVQCRDKWKYLKQRYMKRKDNMKDTHTGEEKIKFEFFNELDDLLAKKPNVEPLAVASSSREDNTPEISTDDGEPVLKKKKTERTDTLLAEIIENGKQREEARERRHQEMKGLKEKSVEAFKSAMERSVY